MASFEEMVVIGRVVRPQGRHGEVVVHPLSDRPGRFETLGRAWVADDGGVREIRVTSSWPHKGRYVLKVEGVESIDDAERLRGRDLRIAEEELEALPDGSYYHHQLSGLRAVDEAGNEIGVVESVMETAGEARILVIQGPEGEMLLPFASTFVRQVDLAGRRIVVARPEYVLAD